MIVRPLAPLFPTRARVHRSPAARGRSARRAVLWGASAFAAATLGLALALETSVPQLRDPEYGYRIARAREQQRAHPDRPLVVLLGTSRTANAFDPSAAGFPDEPGSPLLFNFGLSGSGPVRLRLHLARIRADGVKPDVLLVELFPVLLGADGSDDAPFALLTTKLTVGDVRRLELDDPIRFYTRWARERFNPWHAQRLVLVSRFAPEILPVPQRLDHYRTITDRSGFYRYPENRADEMREERTAVSRSVYERVAREWRVGARSDRAARAIVADCRATGTPVAFYTTPESPVFRSWYTPQSRAAVSAYLRALSADTGCPVFEAGEDYAEGDFADGHHLLPGPAARFTRHLTERHLKPWLAEVRE